VDTVPGRRARTSGGHPQLWRQRSDPPPLAAPTARDRQRRTAAPL